MVDATPKAEQERRVARKQHFLKALEFTYQTLNALDAAQTIDCLHKGYQEANPIFGHHPSDAKIIAYKAAFAGLHYVIYRSVRHMNGQFPYIFEVETIGIQGAVDGLNFRYAF